MISIIVTVYKIEKYIKTCIESILNQTYTDYELILVDDGSPDKCGMICDDYAKRDSRIKVIHQKNQGAVVARWNGFLESERDYLLFIDGDDWIEPNMLEHMKSLADKYNSDIIIVGYKEESGFRTEEKSNLISSGFYSKDDLKHIFQKSIYTGEYYQPGIIAALWNKLIKRSVFSKNFNPANEILKMGDDAAVCYPAIARAKSVVIDNEFKPYHYRILDGSLSHSFDELYFQRAIVLLKDLRQNLENNNYMIEGMKYYSIFISEIGIQQLFSRRCKWNFLRKCNELNNYMREYKKLNISDDIDWSGFNLESAEMLKKLVNNNLIGLIVAFYKQKAKRRINSFCSR